MARISCRCRLEWLEARRLLTGAAGEPFVSHVPDSAAEVVGRYLFYNGSRYDPLETVSDTDDHALAPDKVPLRPGDVGSFANISSYNKGINGLFVDIAHLADPDWIDATDFIFRVGRSEPLSDWQPAPVPREVVVRPGEGVDESDRIHITWREREVANTWLQVVVRGNDDTGLGHDDVFFFGNLIGESGDAPNLAELSEIDSAGPRDHPRPFVTNPPITNPHDYNRDQRVNIIDEFISSGQQRREITTLPMLVAPELPDTPGRVTASGDVQGVSVAWQGVDSADSYEVWRRRTGVFGDAVPIATGITDTTFHDTNLLPDRDYAYSVRAVNAIGTSEMSDAAIAARVAPAGREGDAELIYDPVTSEVYVVARNVVNWFIESATGQLFGLPIPELQQEGILASSNSSRVGQTGFQGIAFAGAFGPIGPPGMDDLTLVVAPSLGPPSVTHDVDGFATPDRHSPDQVVATNSTLVDMVDIRWTSVANAASYQVWRQDADNTDEPIRIAADITGLTYRDLTADPSHVYRYYVRSVVAGGLSPLDRYDLGSPGVNTTQKLTTPVAAASDGTADDGVLVTWRPVPQARDYTIWRAHPDRPEQRSRIAEVTADRLEFLDTTAIPAINYVYSVRAHSDVQPVSDLSFVDQGFWLDFDLQAGPVEREHDGHGVYHELTGEIVVSADQVVNIFAESASGLLRPERSAHVEAPELTLLSNNASRIGLTGFGGVTVEDMSFGFSAPPDLPIGELTLVVAGSLGGAPPVTYRLPHTAITESDLVPAPQELARDDGMIELGWDPIDGAIEYIVSRSETTRFRDAIVIGRTDALSLVDDVLVTQSTYSYWVQAVTNDGVSVRSPRVEITAFPDGTPISVTASDNTRLDGITVTWDLIADAQNYEVWRSTSGLHDAELVEPLAIGTFYLDAGAEPGQTYRYWVRPLVPDTISGFSAPDEGVAASAQSQVRTTANGGQLNVTWPALDGAESYQIVRGISDVIGDADVIEQLAAEAEPHYTDDTATVGIVYHYWVTVVDASGPGQTMLPASGYRNGANPFVPRGVVASDGTFNDQIDVAWEPVDGAVGYHVWRGIEDSFLSAEKVADSVTVTNWSDETVRFTRRYFYWVQSVTAAGTSAPSVSDDGIATELPEAPTNLTVSDGTDPRGILLAWDLVPAAEYYEVWRSNRDELPPTDRVTRVTGNTTYLDQTVLVPEVPTYYWVRAGNVLGVGPFSQSDVGSRAPTPAPSNVAASDGTRFDGVEITWDAVPGAESYVVYRSDVDSFDTAAPVGTISLLSFLDQINSGDRPYYYWVTTVNSFGASGPSASDIGFTAAPIGAPTNVRATIAELDDQIVITWDAVPNYGEYEVWRSRIGAESWNLRATTNETHYNDFSVIPRFSYFYLVRAVGEAGKGPFSDETTGIAGLAAPDEVGLTSTFDAITIAWQPVLGADRYAILRSTEISPDTGIVVADGLTDTSFVDMEVPAGVYVYYMIRAENDAGLSSLSQPVLGSRYQYGDNATATLHLETGEIDITVDGVLQWWIESASHSLTGNLNVDQLGASEVTNRVDRIGEQSEAPFSYAASLGPVTPRFIPAGDLTMQYIVDPALPPLFVPISRVASPGTVTTVEATDGTMLGRIGVSWSEIPEANSYQVWRGTNDDMEAATLLADQITESDYVDDSVDEDQQYTYWVRAILPDGAGAFGPSAHGIAGSWRVPLTASDGTQRDAIVVTWSENGLATNYTVWRADCQRLSRKPRLSRNVQPTGPSRLLTPTLWRGSSISTGSNRDRDDFTPAIGDLDTGFGLTGSEPLPSACRGGCPLPDTIPRPARSSSQPPAS